MMLSAVLLNQWRQLRWFVLIYAILAFATPVITAATLGGFDLRNQPVRDVLGAFAAGGLLFVPIAFLLGVTVGVGPWSTDSTLGFVYLLVHPVPRWYLVLLRFVAGLLLMGIPVAAALASTLLVSAVVTPPEFVQPYPLSLTLRFAAAAVVLYSILFGAASIPTKGAGDPGAERTAVIVVVSVASLVLGTAWLDHAVLNDELSRAAGRFFLGRWSPLGLFMGRWGLFDV